MQRKKVSVKQKIIIFLIFKAVKGDKTSKQSRQTSKIHKIHIHKDYNHKREKNKLLNPKQMTKNNDKRESLHLKNLLGVTELEDSL